MFASPGWMAAQLSEDMYANPKGMPSRLTFKQGTWVDVFFSGLQSWQSAYCKTSFFISHPFHFSWRPD